MFSFRINDPDLRYADAAVDTDAVLLTIGLLLLVSDFDLSFVMGYWLLFISSR